MSKSALDAKRGNIFMLLPEQLTLVTDKNHPLYDPRVETPVDESMVANIAMHGVLEPIIVRKNGSLIEVVAGRGRVKATTEANRRLIAEGKPPLLIPAIVRGGNDSDLFGILISENEIRRDDSMIAKGEKARKLLNYGYSIQQIAVTFGVSRQTVNSWLAAEELPQPIKDAVGAGEITVTAAIQLSDHPKDEQVKRFNEVKAQGKKPTIQTMRDAATADDHPAPVMKKRKEIEKMLDSDIPVPINLNTYTDGFRDALKWVLGESAADTSD